MLKSVGLFKQVVICAVMIAVAGGVWYWRDALLGQFAAAQTSGQERGRGSRSAAPVIVAPVAVAEDDLAVEVVGSGRAQRAVMLKAEDDGRIVQMNLAANRRFKAGDVLVRLEDDREKLALALAQTRLVEAERTMQRFERLRGSGSASQATYDEAATAAEVARLEVKEAERALEDRVLRAPFDGVSALPEVEAGARISTDTDIAAFDDRSVLLVEFDLPERLLTRVEPGLTVEARTPAFARESFAGSVVAIDSRIEIDSRTARVRVAIPNPEDKLRPGSAFTIRLELQGKAYPVVPELAVQFERGALYIWRVTDGKAERVDVRMVRRREGGVLVEGPLEAGEQVVIEGTQRLRDGREVEVTGTRGQAGV